MKIKSFRLAAMPRSAVGATCALGLALLGQALRPGPALTQPEVQVPSMVDDSMPVGEGPRCVAVGDFNGDGKADLVTANVDANTLTVLLGDGNAHFRQAKGSPVATESGPYGVVVADFNRDGKPDLAVANSGAHNVSILLGDGSGRFRSARDSPIAVGPRPVALAVADFDGNGKLDLAVANSAGSSISILLGDGAGGFTTAPQSPYKTGRIPVAVAVADCNGDGKPDVIVANEISNTVSWLAGDEAGGFGARTDLEVGSRPFAVAAADFNNDKKPDLVTANSQANTVSLLLSDGTVNHGAGGLAAKTDVATSAEPVGLAVGDFNGDGKPDVAVANRRDDSLTILLNDGTGHFNAAPKALTRQGPVSVATGDFNGDGKLDLAVANNTSNSVSILLGEGDGRFLLQR